MHIFSYQWEWWKLFYNNNPNKLTDEQKPNCTLTSLGTPVGLLVNRDIVGVRQVPG